MNDKFEIFTNIVCIKEYETLKFGNHYRIVGGGDLSFNCDPNVKDKKGYGFCVQDDNINLENWKKSPEPIWYYFTLNEMDKYFITEEEGYKNYERNLKINQIINDNRISST